MNKPTNPKQQRQDMPLGENHPFAFGRCVVAPAQKLLVGPNGRVHLAQKNMGVLVVLSRFAPDPVPTEYLHTEVWGEQIASGSVAKIMSELRKAFVQVGAPAELLPSGEPYRLDHSVYLDEVTVPTPEQCPYLGLRSYDASQHVFFTGRRTETAQILAKLSTGQHFVLVTGASGSGKSSLLRAGILHEYKKDQRTRCIDIDIRRLADLNLNGLPLETGEPLLVALDHLEAALDQRHAESVRRAFGRALVNLIRQPNSHVVAAVRADQLDALAEFDDLLQLAQPAGIALLTPLSGPQLKDVIEVPAAMAGLTFEGEVGSTVTLADDILADIQSQSDPLPLLSFLLEQLYAQKTPSHELTRAAYQQLGGFAGCLRQQAENAFESLDEQSQAALTPVLLHLCSGAAPHLITRAQPLSSFSAPQRQLVEGLARQRLMHIGHESGRAMVSLGHDALLRHWPRANRILREHDKTLALREEVQRNADQWSNLGRRSEYLLSQGPAANGQTLLDHPSVLLSDNEREFVLQSRRKHRQRRWLARLGVAALCVMLAGLTVTSWRLHKESQRALASQNQASESYALLESILRLEEPSAINPAGPSPDGEGSASVVELAHQALQESRFSPEVHLRVALTLADIYRQQWHLEPMEKLLQGVADRLRREPMVAPRQFAQLYNAQGKLAFYQDQREQSQLLYELAWEQLDEDAVDPLNAKIRNNLGELNLRQARFEQALEHHAEALRLRRALFAPGHRLIGESAQNLAGAYRASGFDSEAETLYSEAITILEAALGTTHPEVAIAKNNLSVLYSDLGQLDQARRLAEQVLTQRREVFGAQHPQTANSLHNLSAILVRQDNHALAEQMVTESIALHRSLFGQQHLGVGAGINNLAKLYLRTGRPAEAVPLLQDYLSGVVAPNGYHGYFYYSLAEAQLADGSADDAAQSIERALKLLPAKHRDIALLTTLKALIWHRLARPFDHAVMLTEPLAQIEQSHGKESQAFRIAQSRVNDVLESRRLGLSAQTD